MALPGLINLTNEEFDNVISNLIAKNQSMNEVLNNVRTDMSKIDDIFKGSQKDNMMQEYSKVEATFETIIAENLEYIEYLKSTKQNFNTTDDQISQRAG